MSKGAFSSRLPRLIEPGKLAQQSLTLEGYIPADGLPRVAEAVQELSNVNCSLRFRIDEQYRRLVTGELHTEALLCCQRCLEPVKAQLDIEVNLALVKDEDQAKDLPIWLEPWVVADVEADLYELVEEELLLSIPQFAWHSENCIDPALYSSGEPVEESVDTRENPFKMLEQLKRKD